MHYTDDMENNMEAKARGERIVADLAAYIGGTPSEMQIALGRMVSRKAKK